MIIKPATTKGNKEPGTVIPFAAESRLQNPAILYYDNKIIA